MARTAMLVARPECAASVVVRTARLAQGVAMIRRLVGSISRLLSIDITSFTAQRAMSERLMAVTMHRPFVYVFSAKNWSLSSLPVRWSRACQSLRHKYGGTISGLIPSTVSRGSFLRTFVCGMLETLISCCLFVFSPAFYGSYHGDMEIALAFGQRGFTYRSRARGCETADRHKVDRCIVCSGPFACGYRMGCRRFMQGRHCNL
jgi:hypothetical protein